MPVPITSTMNRLLRARPWSSAPSDPAAVTADPRAAATRSWAGRRAVGLRVVHVVLIVMLLAATAGTVLGQMQARQALEQRFGLRATLGASFVTAYTDDILKRAHAIAATALNAELVTINDFSRAAAAFGFEAAVLLDGSGRVLHVEPSAPEVVGVRLADRYEHLRLALSGTAAVSNAVESAVTGRPIVAFAVPFETGHGRRVFSGGHHLGATPLSAYLDSAIPFSTASAYLVDANGFIVESNTDDGATLTALAATEPELAEAIGRASEGTLVTGGIEQWFTAKDVHGTPLRLILAVPTAQLYAPLAGPAQWVAWALLGLLAIGAFYLLRVLKALNRSEAALRAAGVELERSNRELQDFASIASHDLQEPLRKIRAFGDRLVTGHADALGDTGQDYLARMTGAAERMQTLINDLLAYSRVATRPHAVEEVALAIVVDEVLDDLEQRIADTGGTIEVITPLPKVSADVGQLRQLMQNLIGNALKYRRADVTPEVRVSCTESSSEWTITVSDNGIGFAQDQADRIFAPFQRLHGRGEYEGTGMGLAICRRIVERHGGTIAAEGRVGGGARFIVTLPRHRSLRGVSS